jgi:hypothetical protein
MNHYPSKKKGDIAVQLKQVARNNIFISHTDNHTIPIIRPWFDSQQVQGLFSCLHTQTLWGTRALSPAVKAVKLILHSVEVMNVCIDPSNLP